jgi:hypothetical protein
MALALLSHHFKDGKNPEHLALIIELQYWCQVSSQHELRDVSFDLLIASILNKIKRKQETCN